MKTIFRKVLAQISAMAISVSLLSGVMPGIVAFAATTTTADTAVLVEDGSFDSNENHNMGNGGVLFMQAGTTYDEVKLSGKTVTIKNITSEGNVSVWGENYTFVFEGTNVLKELVMDAPGTITMSPGAKLTCEKFYGTDEMTKLGPDTVASATFDGTGQAITFTCSKAAEPEVPAVGDEVKAKDATYKVTAEGAVEYEAPADEKATTVTIPDEIKDENGNVFKVTGIAPKAFKGKRIKKLKVGKNVTKIGASACEGCTKLGNVELDGDTVKTVEKNAFKKIKKGAKFKITAKKLKTAEKLLKKINKKGGAKTAVLKYKKVKSSKKSKK